LHVAFMPVGQIFAFLPTGDRGRVYKIDRKFLLGYYSRLLPTATGSSRFLWRVVSCLFPNATPAAIYANVFPIFIPCGDQCLIAFLHDYRRCAGAR